METSYYACIMFFFLFFFQCKMRIAIRIVSWPQCCDTYRIVRQPYRFTPNVFAKHEIAYWKHVLHWNRKEMENENPGIIYIVISFAWRLQYIFEKCTENENFQIFKFTVFTIFFSSKAWNLPKSLKILFFVLYDITYIQNTGNGNNYLNLPIN